MSLRLNANQATKIACQHVAGLDLKNWRYDHVQTNTPLDGAWSAVFDTFSPSGSLVDGPVIFAVRDEDGAVFTLEEWIENKFR